MGIVTGLRATKAEHAVVLTCDVPFVNSKVIQLLMERAQHADAVVPRWGAGQLEPLQAVYRSESMLREAEKALVLGYLSPTSAIKKLAGVVYVSVEDEIRLVDPELRTFFNVNTREDVARAEAILSLRNEVGEP